MTDDLDRLDQELREYAERWRATAPTASMPPLGTEGPGPSRASRWLVPAAAAAVIAVLVGVAVGTGREARDGQPVTGATPTPSASASATTTPGPDLAGVVPWEPLDPGRPEIPRVTTPPSPDPAAAPAAPPCEPSDLRATSAVEGAAGTFALYVTIQPSGPDVSCRLEGHPDVEFLDRGEPVDIPTASTPDEASYPDPVLVAEGEVATLTLYWGSSWCTEPVRNDAIRVALASGAVEVDGYGHSPGCNATPGSGPNRVSVGSFTPQSVRPGRVTSAFRGVGGEISTLGEPVPGAELRFLVTLTARHGDVSLEPCPDYSMVQQGSWDDRSVARFALNCAAVPYRDGNGVPYLPDGVPVRFEMRLGLMGPDVVPLKSTWSLEAADGPVLAIPTGAGDG